MTIEPATPREEAVAKAIAFAPGYRNGTNGEFWLSKARAVIAALDAYDHAKGDKS